MRHRLPGALVAEVHVRGQTDEQGFTLERIQLEQLGKAPQPRWYRSNLFVEETLR